jgi:thiol:disulfide interchange protein
MLQSSSFLQTDRSSRYTARRGNAAVRTILLVGLIAVGVAWAIFYRPVRAGWFDNIDAGLAEAQTQEKPVFVLFTADWCPPCQRMKREALSDPEVMTALEDAFVLVKVDLTERQGPNSAVAAKHGVGSIPTMIVYEADGSRGESATGGQSKEGLLALANRYQRSTDDS